MHSKWDKRFIDLAYFISPWSKDPSTQAGAVITDQKNRLISLGFNGFPRGCDDSQEKYADRDIKLLRVQHAERNAILFANRDLTDCTIYVVPMPPCPQCAGMIIQAGISRVVTINMTDEQYQRWGDQVEESWKMFQESGVKMECIRVDDIDSKQNDTDLLPYYTRAGRINYLEE